MIKLTEIRTCSSSSGIVKVDESDIPMVSVNYFKTDNLVKLNIEDITNLKFGDLVVGVESYGPNLRFVSGMVGEVRDSYIYIMANDNYHGARGSHVYFKDYSIYGLSDEDILCDDFMTKVKTQRMERNK